MNSFFFIFTNSAACVKCKSEVFYLYLFLNSWKLTCFLPLPSPFPTPSNGRPILGHPFSKMAPPKPSLPPKSHFARLLTTIFAVKVQNFWSELPQGPKLWTATVPALDNLMYFLTFGLCVTAPKLTAHDFFSKILIIPHFDAFLLSQWGPHQVFPTVYRCKVMSSFLRGSGVRPEIGRP